MVKGARPLGPSDTPWRLARSSHSATPALARTTIGMNGTMILCDNASLAEVTTPTTPSGMLNEPLGPNQAVLFSGKRSLHSSPRRFSGPGPKRPATLSDKNWLPFCMATELTHRPDKGPNRQGWFVYFGDVCIGHIGMRSGVAIFEPQWGWTCGFSPGCDPRQQTNGSGETFEEARAQFEAAWNRLRPTLTEAHFELWRHDRD